MNEIHYTYCSSPVGILKISATDTFVIEVLFVKPDETGPFEFGAVESAAPVLHQCVNELEEYFNGLRRNFDVPVYQEGSRFQKLVWNELRGIPYGKTISYLELSKRIGDVKAIRAAASTNGRNKISIIVPCHRVIGSNRDLVGYAGGLQIKRWLLHHEAKFANGVQTLF